MDAASEAEWSALTYAHHRTAASAAAPGATFIGRMDNLAQTLVGAALGRAVADRKVPGAALLGALAGNAPDWQELLCSPGALVPRFGPPPPPPPPPPPQPPPPTSYLLYQGGITHSLLGAVAEMAALSALAGLVLHWHARRREAAAYALLVLAAYVGANAAVSVWGKASVRATAIRRFGPEAQWAALAVVGHPFRREPIYAGADTVAGRGWAVPRHLTHPAV